MISQATPQQVFAYIDQLHADIQALVTDIERQMHDRGFIALPQTRDQIYWGTSNDYDRSNRWRVRRVNRFFMRDEVQDRKTEQSVFYGIVLEPDTESEFIPFLVGRVSHPPLTASGIFSGNAVFESWKLNSLTRSTPSWRDFSEEKGWCRAVPDYDSSIEVLRGYILDLFKLDSAETVRRNIIEPLCSDILPDLDGLLTITKYNFPAMSAPDGKEE